MNVLVFEDESLNAQRLCRLISEIDPSLNVVAVIDSVSKGISWFGSNPMPGLIFMDIHLIDGIAFEMFNSVTISAPVIFTTAYDQYAIKAFKINSIDYLLKPIDKEELRSAIDKFKTLSIESSILSRFVNDFMNKSTTKFKTRFLVKIADQLKYVTVEDIAYFRGEGDFVKVITRGNARYIIDSSVEQLEQHLDPASFHRINRKHIISLGSIESIHNYFNGRLKLVLRPPDEEDVFVSRDRVKDFKAWLDS